MLSSGESIRCANGRCEFLSRTGVPITVNDRGTVNRPQMKIAYVVACLLADKLLRPLHCVIEPVLMQDGFELLFRSGVHHAEISSAFVITLEEIHAWLDRSREPGIRHDHISAYVNAAGAETITWILTALFGENLVMTSSEVRIAWRPVGRRVPSLPPPPSAA